jgi:hypothetical protein
MRGQLTVAHSSVGRTRFRSECQGRPATLPRHHPAAVGTPESQLVTRSPEGNRKKRARNFAVLNPTGEAMTAEGAEIPVVREEREVEGAEERKGEFTPVEARSPPSGGETRHQSAPHPNFSGLEAMRKYSILAEGAREGGPDYIPCDWTPGLLIQDIPWNQLPLVCALGRPLGFIPTSHIQGLHPLSSNAFRLTT